jgi:hypothetical protein
MCEYGTIICMCDSHGYLVCHLKGWVKNEISVDVEIILLVLAVI